MEFLFGWYDYYVFGPIVFILFFVCLFLWCANDNHPNGEYLAAALIASIIFTVSCVVFSVDYNSRPYESETYMDLPEGKLQITEHGQATLDLFDLWYNGKTNEFEGKWDKPSYTHKSIKLFLNEDVTSVHIIASKLNKTGRTQIVNNQVMRPEFGTVYIPVEDEVVLVFNTGKYSRSQTFYKHSL